MNIRGFYINLDRSTDRRRRMEWQLERLSLLGSYTRHVAVKGNVPQIKGSPLTDGEIGCFASHCAVLQRAAALGRAVHVMEDDVLLSGEASVLLADIPQSGWLDQFDIVFTETFIPIDLEYLRFYWSAYRTFRQAKDAGTANSSFSILDLRHRLFAGMTSYVVSAKAAATIGLLLEQELQRGPAAPVDLFVRKLIHEGHLRAACIFPFVTSIDLRDALATTIANRYGGHESVLACNILRYSFFVECDWHLCRQLIAQFFPDFRPDLYANQHQELILRMSAFKMFGNYRQF